MDIVEPERTENLVRADSLKARKGFRYLDEDDKTYDYFVPMSDNQHNLYIRRAKWGGQSTLINPDYILIFNVQHNAAGIVKVDQMVEPVEFVVNVEEVE